MAFSSSFSHICFLSFTQFRIISFFFLWFIFYQFFYLLVRFQSFNLNVSGLCFLFSFFLLFYHISFIRLLVFNLLIFVSHYFLLLDNFVPSSLSHFFYSSANFQSSNLHVTLSFCLVYSFAFITCLLFVC